MVKIVGSNAKVGVAPTEKPDLLELPQPSSPSIQSREPQQLQTPSKILATPNQLHHVDSSHAASISDICIKNTSSTGSLPSKVSSRHLVRLKEKAHEKAEQVKEKAEKVKRLSLDVTGLTDKWHGLNICGLWHNTSIGELAVAALQENGFGIIMMPDRRNRSLLVIIQPPIEGQLPGLRAAVSPNSPPHVPPAISDFCSENANVPSPSALSPFSARITNAISISGARALMNFQEQVVECFKPKRSWSKPDLRKSICQVTEIHPDVLWPLHDEGVNDKVLKDIVKSRRLQDILFHRSKLSDLACLRHLNGHFGSDVAFEFLFMSHYIRCLSVLAMVAIPVLIFREATEDHLYDYARPFLGFVTIGWAVFVRELWIPQADAIAQVWNADVKDELEIPLFEFKPWNVTKDPNYYPNWMRLLRTLMMMPAVFGELLLIAFVFVCVFWFEMWVIFEWGQCARINKENGNNLCRSPVEVHGFWGGVVEATPSIVEGILFEAILGITKLIAGWVVHVQNWRTASEKQFAEVTIVFCIEAVGKIGFIANLAFSFVPEWHDKSYDCSQSWEYSIFGDKALSCLKQQIPYEVRRAMLERAMKGPFFVSQLVGMLVKTIIPFLIRLFSAVALKTKEFKSLCGRFIGWTTRHVLRILEIIFYADCDVVGGIPYVWRGMPWKPPTKRGSHGISDSRPDPQSTDERKAIKAMEEGKRREFCVFDEFLEMLLQFLWTMSFTSVAPIFAVLAVSNFLIEMRTDAVKLTYVKRRPFPHSAFQILRWAHRSMRIATVLAMTVNISVLCFSYDSGDLIFHDWRAKGPGSNIGNVTLLAVVTWLVNGMLLLVLLPAVIHRFLPARTHCLVEESPACDICVDKKEDIEPMWPATMSEGNESSVPSAQDESGRPFAQDASGEMYQPAQPGSP